jgi:hypothetical protein
MIYCTRGEQTHWDSTPWSTAREESTITITQQMWFLIQLGNTLYNTWWVYNLNIAFIKTFRSTAFRTPVDDSTSSVRWEVIVRFVDIVGIDDHHYCLKRTKYYNDLLITDFVMSSSIFPGPSRSDQGRSKLSFQIFNDLYISITQK